MWQNTLTYTVDGKTYHRQEKLSKLQGCPTIGAVGWVFIGLAAFIVVVAVGACIGHDYARKKALQVPVVNVPQESGGRQTSQVTGVTASSSSTSGLQSPILQAPAGLNESIDGVE